MKNKIVILSFVLFLAVGVLGFRGGAKAQTIIFSCNFDGSGDSPSGVWSSCGGTSGGNTDTFGSIIDGGVAGKAFMLDVSSGAVYAPMWLGSMDADPITIVFYEKFSKYPIAGANIKNIRPYYGSGSGDYLAAIMPLHFNTNFYQSYWDGATLITGDNVTQVNTSGAYCSDNGDGTYHCNNRMELQWNPGYGTEWREVRVFIDMPSTDSSADGSVKVWIDGEMLYELVDVDSASGAGNTTTRIYFLPSDAADEGFFHYIDEIIVYDGYVEPEIPDTTPPTLSNPQPTGTLTSGTTSTTISLTTNEIAICKYSANSGTNYDLMENTFANTNSTDHSTNVTNLEDGNSYTYYIRCQDESNNQNTDDFEISFFIATHITYGISNFIQLVSDWLKSESGLESDVNGDGVVNTRDLGIMMSNWGG